MIQFYYTGKPEKGIGFRIKHTAFYFKISFNLLLCAVPFVRLYWVVISRRVIKLCYIHTGYDDRCLLWIVNGKLMDLLWIKLA
jgi:hypothetical protein